MLPQASGVEDGLHLKHTKSSLAVGDSHQALKSRVHQLELICTQGVTLLWLQIVLVDSCTAHMGIKLAPHHFSFLL